MITDSCTATTIAFHGIGTVRGCTHRMRPTLWLSLLLATACTTPERTELSGTWERRDPGGNLLERMTFEVGGSFTATASTNPSRPSNFWDLRDVRGSYLVTGDIVALRGTTTDDVRYDIDFTYYVDDEIFVRGAFVEYDDGRATHVERHFHARHSRVFGGMHDIGFESIMDATLEWGVNGWYGLTYTDPLFGDQSATGGVWQLAPEGGVLMERNGHQQRYEMIADGRVLGIRDAQPSSLDVPSDPWGMSLVFRRGE